MSNKIPLSIPSLRGNEIQYVMDCIKTEWVSTAGPYVEEFEKKISEYTCSKYAISCINGTAALQVSIKLAGVEPGDKVIVPTLTFISTINAITYNGATPIFMDADRYFNIDTEKTIRFIENETELVSFKSSISNKESLSTIHKKSGNRISAIVPVHVWGNAAKLDDLLLLCKDRNITIVEDACEALGTFYNSGEYAGKHAGTIGKLGCLSFNGNKIITTGGGGIILTEDKELADKAKYLTTQAKDDPFNYIHHEVGYNFRLTNIHAAIGVAQLEQMQVFLERKRRIFINYQIAFKDVDGLTLADVPNYSNNNHWMNVLKVDKQIFGETGKTIINKLNENGIQSRPLWKLNHLQKPYRIFDRFQIENAIKLVEESICIPSSVNLTDDQIEKTIFTICGK